MRSWVFMSLVALIAPLALTSCSIGQPDQTTITGRVLAESAVYDPSNPTNARSVQATVMCNHVTVETNGDGMYSLRLSPAQSYQCDVTATGYEMQAPKLFGSAIHAFLLNFGVTSQTTCTPSPGSDHIECPALRIPRQTITGIVRYAGGAPAPSVIVECTPTGPTAEGTGDTPAWSATTTTSMGAYSVPDVLPGKYACVAAPDYTSALQLLTVQPGQPATANFMICQHHCPPVHYHLGVVMHTYTAYLIFWLPHGYTFEPQGSDSSFESLIERYFRDVGGTSFYNLLTQYWDYRGYVQNSAALGGAWIDTTPYDHCGSTNLGCHPAAGTRSDPLVDVDIQAAVYRALTANPRWRPGPKAEFFVFTGYGFEECTAGRCSFSPGVNGFCGWHGSYDTSVNGYDGTVYYAYLPDHANDGGTCAFSYDFVSPNGDRIADATINSASHEQFETVTDPAVSDVRAWYDELTDQTPVGGEIGDKCYADYGSVGYDGGNVTLHGDRYILQAEWSNRANACAFS